MRVIRTVMALLVATLAFIPSCASLAVPQQDAKDSATVTGIVKFKGPKPERKENTDLLGQPFCKAACAGKAPLEEKWVFGKNGDDDTFANVLVYVSKGLEGKTFEPPKDAVVLDQAGCTYSPHVVSLMVGQTLEVRNSDATAHNVLCNPFKNKAFNESMQVKGGKFEKIFTARELKVDLRCILHPWMLAYVHVLEHPFHAVTKEDGSFTIKGLPPGEYELSVKHESPRFAAEPATVSIKVGAGESKKIEFVYQDKQQ